MVNNQTNCNDNLRKSERLHKRLSPYLKENFDVLDVGAGEAWAMDYFCTNKCNDFAIDAVSRLSESIEGRGGKIVGETLFDDYSDYHASFDVIIFRHVLEHLLTPRKALINLKNMLKQNGIIYLAVPNAAKPSIKKGFLSSFIRPVHVSYFCEGNIRRLANSVGLKALYSEAKGEIYCLLGHGDSSVDLEKSYYLEQKEVFLKKKKEALIIDIRNILIDIVRTVAKKIIR